MPSIRIGYSTDFNLNNELVGIGVTTATSTLDVAGQIVADNTAASGGVSTFREYQGFQQIQQDISNNILIDNGSNGNFNSLSGEIRISGETTVSSSSTITGGKLETLTITDKFAVPLGDTNSRDNTPEAGTTRFNQDFGTLEFFDGNNWKTVNSYSRGGAAGRGVFGGGYHPRSTLMTYVNISSEGNSAYFGELFESASFLAGKVSDGKRGVFAGGRTSPANALNNEIQYITISSTGNTVDFGNLTVARRRLDAVSSSTRGIVCGGYDGSSNSDVLDYFEIQTLGDAIDFGNLTDSRYSPGAISSSTRGVICGGGNNDAENRTMDYITISSKGNAVNFGECTRRTNVSGGGFSTGVRGVLAGGFNPSFMGQIEQINISSTGNSFDFGDLHLATRDFGGAQNMTRGLLAGGYTPGTSGTNKITKISLETSGTSSDFGELSSVFVDKQQVSNAGLSDSHGGLGGF